LEKIPFIFDFSVRYSGLESGARRSRFDFLLVSPPGFKFAADGSLGRFFTVGFLDYNTENSITEKVDK
jgi:hypothetical protein